VSVGFLILKQKDRIFEGVELMGLVLKREMRNGKKVERERVEDDDIRWKME